MATVYIPLLPAVTPTSGLLMEEWDRADQLDGDYFPAVWESFRGLPLALSLCRSDSVTAGSRGGADAHCTISITELRYWEESREPKCQDSGSEKRVQPWAGLLNLLLWGG